MRRMAVDKITRVDLANEILLEYLVNIRVPMNAKDVPVRLDTAANSAKDHIATRVVWNPVRDIIDPIAAIDPVAFSFTIVVIDLVKPEKPVLRVFVVVFRWRFRMRLAA